MAVEHDIGWGRKVRPGRRWLDVVRGGRMAGDSSVGRGRKWLYGVG